MAARGWRQADLARASGASKAAVSETLGGRSTPSVATLEALADALGFEGVERTGLFRLRDAAEDRVRRLDDYLDAALRAVCEHPYASAPPGGAPPLTGVYLGQNAVPRRAAGSLPRPAHELLAQEGTCVLVAGAGGGKSSLLRMLLADTADAWRHGRGGAEVPVLVPAAALARAPLAAALADCVNTDLAAHGLIEKLPDDFFAKPHRPGVRWLVLVDALDEVPDSVARRRVTGLITAVRTGARAEEYRFVVATRPLPDGELTALGDAVPHYDLLPFAPADVEKVAEAWLRALGTRVGEYSVKQFTKALETSGLTDAARVPLMASMLCQLYAADPTEPLPDGRGPVYREFVSLLRGRSREYRAAALRAECDALAAYSRAAAAQAQHVLEHLDELTAELAAHLNNGIDVPLIALAQSLSGVQCPAGVPDARWRAFLHVALRADGLLTARGSDLEFLHQTLLEYLAARHATRNSVTTLRTLREVEALDGVRGSSFVGFVLDAMRAADPSAWSRYLTTPPRRGVRSRLRPFRRRDHVLRLLQWADLIALQSSLGTDLPAGALPAARDAVTRLIANGPFRFRMAEKFVAAMVGLRLGVGYSAERLHAVATDTGCDPIKRIDAAAELAEHDDPRGLDALHALATDTRLNSDSRALAAESLAELHDPRAPGALHILATDPRLYGYDRLRAAKALVELHDPRAPELLHAVATDTSIEGHHRLDAAERLAGLDVPRAVAALQSLAADTDIDGYARPNAAEALVRLNDPRAQDLLHLAATDVNLNGYVRLHAADALARLHDSRALDPLRAIVADISLRSDVRLRAARGLVTLDDPHAADVLHALVTDTGFASWDRVLAAETLLGLDDARGPDLLQTLVTDTSLDGDPRLHAAEALLRLDDRRAPDLLHALVADTGLRLEDDRRVRAAAALAELHDPRAPDLLYALATDAGAAGSQNHRRRAAELYTRIEERTHERRVHAAAALAELHDPRAPDLLYALTTDPSLALRNRILAAKALAELQDPRTSEAIRQLWQEEEHQVRR